MKITALLLLPMLLSAGCSTPGTDATAQRPQFDIRSADVVAVVVYPSNESDHKAEILLDLTEDCVKRYAPFGKKHVRQDIDLLANGRLLLEGLYAPEQIDTNITVFIFTSVEDARSLAESLNKK